METGTQPGLVMRLALHMSAAQIAEARRLAREWKPRGK
jgi:hypothetical protein